MPRCGHEIPRGGNGLIFLPPSAVLLCMSEHEQTGGNEQKDSSRSVEKITLSHLRGKNRCPYLLGEHEKRLSR